MRPGIGGGSAVRAAKFYLIIFLTVLGWGTSVQAEEICMDMAQSGGAFHRTPTERVPLDEYPLFVDDLDFAEMAIAIQRQVHRYTRRSLRGRIQLGQDVYPLRRLKDSLLYFSRLVQEGQACLDSARKTREECYARFRRQVKQNFAVYRPLLEPGDPRYGEDQQTFFTGYYTPLIEVKMSPQGKFQYPIYAMPQEENLARLTRVEIDFDHQLRGHGYELFYAADLFQLYLLHVQGGGRVVVREGGESQYHYITYAGTNRRAWRFISIYMRDQGYISDLSVESQKQFLRDNPHLQREIYEYCPSYVFFKVTETPPLGSDLVPLTDNRSIATDSRIYRFKGLLSFIEAQRPKVQNIPFKPFSRFVIDQDTGGAIRGKARVDIYFGEGDYAQLAAYNTQHRGDLYFLMLKRPICARR